MSLRSKVLLYLVLIHGVLGGVAFVILAKNRLMLAVIEALFVLSIVLGGLLVRSFFVPLRMIRTGAELIQEGDFTAHFREVGQPEMDGLIRIYNKMIDRLREERLRVEEQHSFLHRVLAASPAGVVTLDFDGRVAQVNPSAERLLGVPTDRLVGRALTEVESPLAGELAAVVLGRSRVVGVAGRQLKCSRAEFYDRGFARAFFVIEEMTEELRASERAAYGKIIRIVSHEVNNSVGAVSSLLDSARTYAGQLRDEDRDDFRHAVDVAIARMDHVRDFLKGFADVVRIPAPDKRPCDLKLLLDDLIVLLRPEMERRGIVCDREYPQVPPPIPMDKNQIEQVLVNVLKNAMEAIDGGGRITLRLETLHDGPVLTVTDTGCGIAPEVKEHLFTPFFSTKRDGRGLGLTVVREILAQHRFEGSLEARPGGGAEFRIRFRR